MAADRDTALRNLAKAHEQSPPWTSETTPKPQGRRNAGLSINEWRNEMASWSKDEITSAMSLPKTSAAQLIAGQELLDAIAGKTDARRDVSDYSGNKPTTTNINHSEVVHVRRTVIHANGRN